MGRLVPHEADRIGVSLCIPHPAERAAEQEQQIGGVDGRPLRGDLHPLHHLQKRVLRPLAVRLTPIITVSGQLVYLIDENDGVSDSRVLLEARQQVGHDVRRVFPAIPRLGDAGGIHSEKRQPCDPGCLTDDGRLAAPTGPIQQQIGSGNAGIPVGAEHLLPNCQRHGSLCLLLPDDGLIQFLNDVLRRDRRRRYSLLLGLVRRFQNMKRGLETTAADHPAGAAHHMIVAENVDDALAQGAARDDRGSFFLAHVITPYFRMIGGGCKRRFSLFSSSNLHAKCRYAEWHDSRFHTRWFSLWLAHRTNAPFRLFSCHKYYSFL